MPKNNRQFDSSFIAHASIVLLDFNQAQYICVFSSRIVSGLGSIKKIFIVLL